MDTPTLPSAEIDQLPLKLIWERERPRRVRTILKQDNAGGLTLPSNEMAQLRPRRDMQVRAVEPPVQTRAVTLTGNWLLPRLPRQPTGAGTTRRPRAHDGAEALPQIQKK